MSPPPDDDAVVIASHEVLFVDDAEPVCDACGAVVRAAEDDDGFAIPGAAVYLWTRGTEVRFEKAPLCPSCATIGMTALARWEIEEEEG